MITSYVNPGHSLLYLSLVGPLNETGANDLVQEYYERLNSGLKQCILDLSEAAAADGAGLNVLHRISLLAQVDEIEFSVIAGRSPVEREIGETSRRFRVPVVDARAVPFARQAG